VGQVALGYTIVAGLGLATGAAVPLCDILLGQKWEASAPLLSLLAASAALQTLGYFGYWVYVSKAITGALFKYNLLSVAIKIVCLVVGAHWGIVGVGVGYLISTAVSWPLSLAWIAKSVEGVPIKMFTMGFIRMAALATAGAGVAYLVSSRLSSTGPWGAVGLATVAVTLVYVLGALLLPTVRHDVRDLALAGAKLRHG
ncbi:MAG: lipopolysaccharide biosynthesis protein, partial [Chloroflexota bacterium]|nr:lipopolysaccharide biosynthesis protein [Chloroflexota bacterium]